MKKKLTQIFSLLLTLTLLLGVGAPALAAETAATMRLAMVEGTAKVTNASGKEVKLKDNMRLYNGYSVKTDKASYAYISLDGTKVIKLDASSEATVIKAGRKLEVKLNSGKLFFNVTMPLEKDETLNIRTSTMVTGIRGTSGWIEVTSRFESMLGLLEGTVLVTCTDPASGITRSQIVKAGEIVRSVPEKIGQHGADQQVLILEKMREEDVPGFVREEIAKDPELQQKIREQTNLDVDKLISTAEEKRREDEQKAEEKDKIIQEEASKLVTDKVDPVFDPKEEPAVPSGGGSPAVDPYTLTDPTFAELVQALETSPEGTTVTVNNANGTPQRMDPNGTDNLTIPKNKTLTLNSGTMNAKNITDVNGTMNVNNGAELNNTGTMNVNSTNSLHINGTMENDGFLNVGNAEAAIGQPPTGRMTVSGKLLCTGNSWIGVANGSELVLSGTVDLQDGNPIEVGSNSKLIVNGGTVQANGTVANILGDKADFVFNGGTVKSRENTIIDPMTGYIPKQNQDKWFELNSLVIDGVVTLTDPAEVAELEATSDNVDKYLKTQNVHTVVVQGGTQNLAMFSVPAGKTLKVEAGTTMDNKTFPSRITGTLEIAGGTVNNWGSLLVESGGVLKLSSGTLTNITDVDANPSLTAVLNNSGTVTVTGGTLTNFSKMTNTGTFTVAGGTVSNAQGGSLENSGTVTVGGGNVENSGSLTTTSGGTMNLNTGGTLTNAYHVNVENGGSLKVAGGTYTGNPVGEFPQGSAPLQVNGTMEVTGGTVKKKGGNQNLVTLSSTGSLTVAAGGTVDGVGGTAVDASQGGTVKVDGGTVKTTGQYAIKLSQKDSDTQFQMTTGDVTSGGGLGKNTKLIENMPNGYVAIRTNQLNPETWRLEHGYATFTAAVEAANRPESAAEFWVHNDDGITEMVKSPMTIPAGKTIVLEKHSLTIEGTSLTVNGMLKTGNGGSSNGSRLDLKNCTVTGTGKILLEGRTTFAPENSSIGVNIETNSESVNISSTASTFSASSGTVLQVTKIDSLELLTSGTDGRMNTVQLRPRQTGIKVDPKATPVPVKFDTQVEFLDEAGKVQTAKAEGAILLSANSWGGTIQYKPEVDFFDGWQTVLWEQFDDNPGVQQQIKGKGFPAFALAFPL